MKDLGTVHDGERDVIGGGGGEHLKTLAQGGFQAGDFLDIAVLLGTTTGTVPVMRN